MKRYFAPTVMIPVAIGAALLTALLLLVLRGVSGPQLQAVALLLAALFFWPLLSLPVILADYSAPQRGLILSFFFDLMLFTLAILLALTPLNWRDALSAGAVLCAWMLLTAGFASSLRFFGRGLAVSLAFSLHTICFFVLIIAPPIFRNTPVTWHDALARIVGWICPGLILQESVRSTLAFSWTQMDFMYTLTTFDQDIPLPIPTWWHAAIAYAGTGIVLLAVGWGAKKCLNVKM